MDCTAVNASHSVTHAVSCEMRPSVLHLVMEVSPEGDVTLISGEEP